MKVSLLQDKRDLDFPTGLRNAKPAVAWDAGTGRAYATRGGRFGRAQWAHEVMIVEVDLLAYPDDVSCLSPDEGDRATRFICPDARRRYVTARVALRWLLAEITGAEPARLQFSYNSYGKPALFWPDPAWEFNISHSGERALMGFARSRSVGVDIEDMQTPISEMEDLARRFFSRRECEALLSLDGTARQQAFYRCWTRKEAVLKALGKGMSIPLSSFSVSLELEAPSILSSEKVSLDPHRWVLANVPVTSGYCGCMAVEPVLKESASEGG